MASTGNGLHRVASSSGGDDEGAHIGDAFCQECYGLVRWLSLPHPIHDLENPKAALAACKHAELRRAGPLDGTGCTRPWKDNVI